MRASHRVASALVVAAVGVATIGALHRAGPPGIKGRGPVPVAMLAGEPVERYPIREMDGTLRADPKELLMERSEALAKAQALGGFDEPIEVIEDRLAATRQVRETLRSQADAAQADESATWQALGPHNVGGRTHSIAIDPRNPQVMYGGGIAGGLWKSDDAGASWRPLAGTPDNLPISAIVMSPQDPDVLYVGTGDTVEQFQRRAAQGAGIMVSRDAGQSWSFLDSTRTGDFYFVNQIKISPRDAARIYVGTSTGFWLSENGGQSWAKTLESSDYLGCREIAVRDDQATDHLLVSCGGLATSDGVFFSDDGGESWRQTVGSINNARVGRTAVAFAPSDQNVAYASASGLDGIAIGLLRSDQGGMPGSWEIVNVPTGQPGSPPWFGWCDDVQFSSRFGQGYYDNVLAVSPTDPDVVFIGGVDNFRSDDGGRTMYPISYWWAVGLPDGSQYNHADQHFYVFHPDWDGAGNQTLYTGNDGGMFRTDNALARADSADCLQTDNAVTWSSLNNGYATSLFREGVVSDNGIVAGGLQDNGTQADYDITPPPNDWTLVLGGDGGWTAIDPTGRTIYTTYPGGYVDRVTDGVAMQATRGLDVGTGLFVPPLVMDRTNPEILWVGLTKMFRTTNGADFWEPASGPFGAGIETIAVSPTNGQFLLASTEDGRLFRTTNGYDPLPIWEQVGGGLPRASLSQFDFDPTNDQIVYLTVNSFQDVGTVFKSTDGGDTWTNIDGTAPRAIPDTAAYSVAVNPLNTQNIFVGTDTGVFESRDGGATWEVEIRRLTTTTVEDLFFQPGTSKLFVFTYGRAVYLADVGS